MPQIPIILVLFRFLYQLIAFGCFGGVGTPKPFKNHLKLYIKLVLLQTSSIFINKKHRKLFFCQMLWSQGLLFRGFMKDLNCKLSYQIKYKIPIFYLFVRVASGARCAAGLRHLQCLLRPCDAGPIGTNETPLQ